MSASAASLPPLPPRWRLALLALPLVLLWIKILASAPVFARTTLRSLSSAIFS